MNHEETRMNVALFDTGLGMWGAYAGQCLMGLAIGALLLFGLPMMLWPLRWARLLGWASAPQDHLAIYFGRTLGMVTCALSIVALMSVNHPSLRPVLYNLNIMIFLANTGVHAWGAIKRIQPLAETLEIPYWFGLAVVLYLFYPGTHWHWV
jgi:hypothetical protein